MSTSEDAPSREVAYRLFAAEFDDADYGYSESDEERAPNYVVTPTGLAVNRLFFVGVLTEVERVNEEVVRARVVDPTGAFVVYAGQYQPDELAFLERAESPAFVAVTGKARTFQPEDSDVVYTSVRPESVNAVDAETRDRWVVETGKRTLERVATFAGALGRPERGDDLRDALAADGVDSNLASGIPRAIDHYGTTGGYLAAVREMSVDTLRVISGGRDEVEALSVAPDEGGEADLAALSSGVDLPGVEFADEDGSSDVDETGTTSQDPSAASDTVDGDQPASAGEPTADEPEAESSEAADAGTPGDEASTEADAIDGERESGNGAATTADLTEGESPDKPVGTDEAAGAPVVDEPEAEPDEAADAETAEAEAETSGTGDEAAETDEMYEFSDEEREEIEEEYGVEFSSGSDIPDAGEADIETPDSDPDAAESAEGATADLTEGESPDKPVGTDEAAGAPTADEPEAEPDEAADAGDVDLEDAVVETMQERGDGGVERDELVEAVSEEYDADPDAVEDAIQDALMSGRCYESGDGELTPI